MPTLVEKIALVLGKAAPAKRPSEDLTSLIQLLVKARPSRTNCCSFSLGQS